MPTFRSQNVRLQLLLFSLYFYPFLNIFAIQPHSSAWLQCTSKGLELRALYPIKDLNSVQTCSQIMIDARPVTMQIRATATKDYPSLVCSALIPSSVRQVKRHTHIFTIHSQPIERIILLGDTGCKVDDNEHIYQSCNNPSLWPFQLIASEIAKLKPHLIIHTGDYIYREAPCPIDNNGCLNTPYGHNQATWNADWFTPATPMLNTAPFIFLRGNHETCPRAGEGWFRYLAPRHYITQCVENTAPWFTAFSQFTLSMLDTANIKNHHKKALTPLFTEQLNTINAYAKQDPTIATWIISHRPFWSYGTNLANSVGESKTKTLQKAVKKSPLIESIDLIISGHLHFSQFIDFKGARPTQIIAGNGGSDLAVFAKTPNSIDGLAINVQKVRNEYGFIVMDKMKQNHWIVSIRDIVGDELVKCTLTARSLFY
ncbi:metallophosphoesterase [uncultured Shewanella sp.]|uniref:metallophosphoesterase family protein n=1 Tax=uncultured Shewanella sp. TaxID=173975 RepID=UPI00263541BE|nr:metallophosphoesterase [uncultured Shewanella sp.]